MMHSFTQSILVCFILSLSWKTTVADEMTCMTRAEYKDQLEIVRVQSSMYQNMKADGTVSKRYYEDTYVLLNIGSEPLCNVELMLMLTNDNNDNNNKELPAKLSGLPPDASPRETSKQSEGPLPSKDGTPPMKVYAMEGIKVQIETSPHAIYPKVTGKGRRNPRSLGEIDSDMKKELPNEGPWIMVGSLPDLYLGPNDADMFGFTLSSVEKDAPLVLPELCVVSYQTCTIDTLTEGQKNQMEDLMQIDRIREPTVEEMKKTYTHPRKATDDPRAIYGIDGLHPVRRLVKEEPISIPEGQNLKTYSKKGYSKRPKWHRGWMKIESLHNERYPVNHGMQNERYPVNHGMQNERYPVNHGMQNERYPINLKFKSPNVKIGGMDIINFMPTKASRFDVAIVDAPEQYLALPREEEEENSETEDYLALPREEEEENSETENYQFIPGNEHGPGGDHAVRKRSRYLRK